MYNDIHFQRPFFAANEKWILNLQYLTNHLIQHEKVNLFMFSTLHNM